MNLLKTYLSTLYAELRGHRAVAKATGLSVYHTRNLLRMFGVQFYKPVGRATTLGPGDSGRYTSFVKAVMHRDEHTCQVCGAQKDICVHHIRTWSKHPDLRFDPSNGITLCRECHYLTYKREEEYEWIFANLLFLKDVPLSYVPGPPPIRPTDRVCSSCGEEKALDDFMDHKQRPWGKSWQCKECQRLASNRRYHEHTPLKIAIACRWAWDNRAYRTNYIAWRDFILKLQAGEWPSWSKKRAFLGLVPQDKGQWPTTGDPSSYVQPEHSFRPKRPFKLGIGY